MKSIRFILPLTVFITLMLANPAYAVDPLFTVTSTADTSDGTCDAHCTLREAMIAANGVSSSKIVFDAGVFAAPQVINLASALPPITASVTIEAGFVGVTIRRNSVSKYRIFTIPNAGLTVKMNFLTISNGDTNSDGGGIYSKSYLELFGVTVDGNRSGNSGGGVALLAGGSISLSTISNNSADWAGGLYLEPAPSNPVVMDKSTVSGNTSSFGTAIMLANITHETSVALGVFECTIAYNTGNSSGILSYAWGANRQTYVNLTSTILANNGLQNLGQSIGNGGSVNYNSLGYNLATDAPGALTNTGDQVNKDPLLAPLALYGSRTPTPVHALRSGSPALDQGNSVGIDQRYLGRPFDIAAIANAFNGSDIGAVEMQALNVTNADDSGVGSLRQALLVANADGAANDDILFDSVFFATPRVINLASALGPITSSVNLLGPGADRVNLRRNTGGDYRIITNTTAVLYLGIHDMTLSNGNSTGGGGGIYSSSYLDLRRSVVSGNHAVTGGGISLVSSGVIESSTISGNSVTGNAGGIDLSGGPGNIVQLVNSTISNNSAGDFSAIVVAGEAGAGTIDLKVVNSTIANNTGGNDSVLIDVSTSGVIATATLVNSMFANNSGNSLSTFASPGSQANIVSLGHNLATDSGLGYLSGPSDLINTDPLLYPLANYGGPTPTRLMAPGSPAVDAGNCAISGVTRDQRGKQRPFDRPGSANAADACDIGAVEWSDLNGSGTEDSVELFDDGFE